MRAGVRPHCSTCFMNHVSFNWFDLWEASVFYLWIRTCRRCPSLSWSSGIGSPISINSCLSFPFTPSSCSHLKETSSTDTYEHGIKVHLYPNNPILMTPTDAPSATAPATTLQLLQHSSQFTWPDESTSWYLVKQECSEVMQHSQQLL